jgi:hypothetical protein
VPSSGFSDWPAQQKKQRKKVETSKFLICHSKLQAGVLIKISIKTPVRVPASSCFTPAFFEAPIDLNLRLWAWDALPRGLIAIVCGYHHQKPQFVIWNVRCGILKAQLFFDVFGCAGQSENPELGKGG